MPSTFPLPCSCGQTVPVTAAQSGRVLHCPACQAELLIPSLRELRRLAENVGTEEPAARSGEDWDQTRGLVFTGGALVLLAALSVMGYACYKAAGIRFRDGGEVVTKQSEDEIRALNADQVYEVWRNVRVVDLAATQSTAAQKARAEFREWRRIAIVSIVIALLGTIAAGTGFIRRSA